MQRGYDGGRGSPAHSAGSANSSENRRAEDKRLCGGPLLPSSSISAFGRIRMTATAILFTSAGFAVAADGRQMCWGHTATCGSAALVAERENEQKIFEVPGVPVAFIIRGDTTSRDRVFNIPAMLQDQIADVLHSSRDQSLYRFADAVSVVLKQAIERARYNGIIEDYPETEITFVGYMREQPGWVDVRFYRYADALVRDVVRQDCDAGCWYSTGSRVIRDLIVKRDPGVPDVYGLRSQTMPLDDAVVIVRAYVETCCSPLGMEVDAEHCASIGGHVHVATVCPFRHIGIWERWRRAFRGIGEMPNGGFRWLIPPRAVG